SGNVVHNLRMVDWGHPDAAFDWNRSFDEEAREIMRTDPSQIGRLQDHPAYDLAVPTPDHFLPLLYVAGLAAASGRPASTLVDGYSMGSLSMTAYGLDVDCPTTSTLDGAQERTADRPADQTNL